MIDSFLVNRICCLYQTFKFWISFLDDNTWQGQIELFMDHDMNVDVFFSLHDCKTDVLLCAELIQFDISLSTFFIPTSRFPWFKWKCMVSLQKTLISVGELNSVLSAFFFPIHLSYIWLVEFLVFKVQDWFWILILEMHYLGRWYRRPTYVCREKLNGYLWSFVDTKHSRHRDNRYTCEGFSVLPTCRYHLCSWFSFVLLSKILYKQLS